jgi:hypothetical protein
MIWKGHGRKRSWSNLRYYPGVCLGGLQNATISLRQDSRAPERACALSTVPLYGASVKMRGDVNKVVQGEVLLLLSNLVPHPVSFYITVLDFTKNEIAVILFFAAITIWSAILDSIY